MRILHAVGGGAVAELNYRYVSTIHVFANYEPHCRYRLMPTFGRDTIRRFHNNASEMKKLAGRDYEDLLQVGAY
jgi:hypothetical protein